MPNPASNKALIYDKALALLSRREHSSHELFLKLKQRFPGLDTDIKEALATLQAKQYLVDQRFAEMITRHRAAQGYGPNYIKQELKSHRVTMDEAYFSEVAVMSAFFEGWLRKFKTRFKTLPSNALGQAKLMRYFLQRGFLREQITAFMEQVKSIK